MTKRSDKVEQDQTRVRPPASGDSSRATDETVVTRNKPTSEATSPPPKRYPNKTSGTRDPASIEPDEITHSSEKAIGKIIKGRFVITQHLGDGGMGSVYKARDIIQEQAHEKNPWVAIKLLDMVELNNQDALMWLQRETSKARSLAHPNVIRVYDIDKDGDQVYMTMEYLEGISLETWIEKHSPATVEACEPIWKAVAAAVDFSHQMGIVHCDLKPSNVLISNEGEIKVIDFGIARGHAEGHQDVTVFNPGDWGAFTPGYASCELITGLSPEPKDDIYSMSVLMYKMLTGRKPFGDQDATKAKMLGLQPRPIKGVSPAFWEQLKKGLSFERKSRPNSALALLPDSQHKKIPTKAIVAISVMGLAAGVAYFTLVPERAATPEVESGHSSAERPPVKALAPEVAEEIAVILDIAQAHFEMEFYVRPAGANAREAYMHVLTLDPTNEQALEGLNKVAEHFLTNAKEYIEAHDYERAGVAIAQGLKTVPEHKALLDLQKNLETL
ncbi:serine/threonine-protein kinase [Alteromonas sp. ASW11-130]|uniref:serine/threonine-protein kinase n=1 Tax=Alteromonas sp. ASW11-130 TaxID=3015775 RepID=UPI002241BD09|nr:serine/threonine-protein kinase [Alteromonas sp. ASW11-130]MCW8091158.1 serine/threonine protein kinase [Alteromonas sp. ASW11-130]